MAQQYASRILASLRVRYEHEISIRNHRNTPRTCFEFSNVLDTHSDFNLLPSQSTPIVLPLVRCPRLLSQRICCCSVSGSKPTILMCFKVGVLSHILPGVTAEGYKNLRVAHSRAKLWTISRSNTSRLTKLSFLLQHTRTTASVLGNG